MPLQAVFSIYSFSELSEEAKEKVRERAREHYPEDGWYEGKQKEWEEFLGKLGYYNVEIAFTGFWSQGDGASFTAHLDIKKYLETIIEEHPKFKPILEAINEEKIDVEQAEIKRDRWHHYVHWNTTSLYMSYRDITGDDGFIDSEKFAKLFEQLEEHIFEEHQTFNRQIYSELEQVYDNCSSQENLDDYIINGLDREYFEDGKVVTNDYKELPDSNLVTDPNIQVIEQPKTETTDGSIDGSRSELNSEPTGNNEPPTDSNP